MTQPHNDLPDIDLGQLIQELGPLNNSWRGANPASKVVTLWDMGDMLLKLVPNPNDQLLWNIQQRSYITRNILRYALIIRRGWAERRALEQTVQGLRNYTVFREALPFLKGKRENIDEETYQKVLSLLYSDDTNHAIVYLKALKEKSIGRNHKKGASTTKVQGKAVTFNEAFLQLEKNVDIIAQSLTEAQRQLTVSLSKMVMVIATGEVIKTVPSFKSNGDWTDGLLEPLQQTIEEGRPAMAAFRKIVGPDRLIQAADLLNALRNEQAFSQWQQRRKTNIKELW